jgi:hypothetical protein
MIRGNLDFFPKTNEATRRRGLSKKNLGPVGKTAPWGFINKELSPDLEPANPDFTSEGFFKNQLHNSLQRGIKGNLDFFPKKNEATRRRGFSPKN